MGMLVPHGVKEATTDKETVRRWWTQRPDANVGIATGVVSGIVVLDVDPRHGGDRSLAGFECQHGLLPKTVVAITGGGGRHLFFAYPCVVVRNAIGLAPGLDVRGDGGYVIAPPSRHETGQLYRWVPGQSPSDVVPAECPQWLRALTTRTLRRPPESGSSRVA
jgi:hypothetical protein